MKRPSATASACSLSDRTTSSRSRTTGAKTGSARSFTASICATSERSIRTRHSNQPSPSATIAPARTRSTTTRSTWSICRSARARASSTGARTKRSTAAASTSPSTITRSRWTTRRVRRRSRRGSTTLSVGGPTWSGSRNAGCRSRLVCASTSTAPAARPPSAWTRASPLATGSAAESRSRTRSASPTNRRASSCRSLGFALGASKMGCSVRCRAPPASTSRWPET